MNKNLIVIIQQLNPWLISAKKPILQVESFIARKQTATLLNNEWDKLCTVIVGPRQAGKTTLGLHICEQLIQQQRFDKLLYLNCDYSEIRNWLKDSQFVHEAFAQFNFTKPIILIDEIQRLENPGLLLKTIIDLKLPIKLIVTGSSQLELKSKVQEYLTGRQLEIVVLPLSWKELQKVNKNNNFEDQLLYGSYPQIVQTKNKEILLKQLYDNYINKDIIEILRLGKPDVMQKLIKLIAHSAGQLVNYNQLATDCGVSNSVIRNYLSILEQTYVISCIKPFVGNKRTEITNNPIYYFIDNGFRNQALNNFSQLDSRTDKGLLIENYIFQELCKFNTQNFNKFNIYFWRTKAGAEVDFVFYKNQQQFIPIEVKYQNMQKTKISRGFRSFLEAYQPSIGVIITQSLIATLEVEKSKIYFIPLEYLDRLFMLLAELN